jgi:pSer/pThr/pTyr-binding forkhead associated (FHA) protein
VSTDKTLLVGDMTRIASPEEMERVKASLAESAKRAPAPPPAALLLTDSGSAPHEYRLGELNGIGRSDQNAIHIVRPGISRTHALVTARSNGFVIKDLDSQNGTYVNGERIAERELADGDKIEIGTVQFVFRMPWPAGGGASGASAGQQARQ